MHSTEFPVKIMIWQRNECVSNVDQATPKIDVPIRCIIIKKSICAFAKVIYAIQPMA